MPRLRVPRGPVFAPTPEQERRAGIWCAAQATSHDGDPHDTTRELLQALGLLDDPGRILRDPMHSHKIAPGQGRRDQ